MTDTDSDRNVRFAHASEVELTVDDAPWAYATQNCERIAAHFAQRKAENPSFYNGSFYVCARWDFSGDVFHASLLRSDFASFLFWRDAGYADRKVRMLFGSPAIRSSEGHLLLGVMGDDTVHPGLMKFPTGAIEDRDVKNGRVDLEANMVREVREETGLPLEDATPDTGWTIVFDGPWISATRCYAMPYETEGLSGRVRTHLAGDPAPELKDIHIARTARDIVETAMPGFVAEFIRRQFRDQA